MSGNGRTRGIAASGDQAARPGGPLNRGPGGRSQGGALNTADGCGETGGQRGRGKRAMEYRYLGRSGLQVSVLTMGTMTFAKGAGFKGVGANGLAEAREQIDLCLDAGVNLIDTANIYSKGEFGGDHRRGAGRQAAERRADRLQGPLSHRGRAERRGVVAASRHQAGGGQPEAAADGCDRHPLPARVGRHDAAGGNLRRTRHPRSTGQDPLRGRIELFRLARDEGAGHRRGARVPAAGRPSRSTTRSRPARRSTSSSPSR